MRASKIAIAAVLMLLGACAQTEAPAPNKNTNWLQECGTDADCGQALSCICGVCTERCEDEDACGESEGMATCRHERSAELIGQCGEAPRWSSVCVAACEDDVDCAYVGEGAHCEQGACIASTNMYVDRTSVGASGDGGADEAPCVAYGDGCAELVATGLERPSGLVVKGERVYWLNQARVELQDARLMERTGSFESALVSGADRVTLARELQRPFALALDATHAYFLLAYDDAQTGYTKLGRMPLAGGELEILLDDSEYYFSAIVMDEANVYCAGFSNLQAESAFGPVRSLYRVPKAVSSRQTAPDVILDELIGKPWEIAMSGSTVLWKNGGEIRAVDVARGDGDKIMVESAGDQIFPEHPFIAVSAAEIAWISSGEGSEISRLNLDDPGTLTRSVYAERGVPVDGLVADGQYVWWFLRGGPELRRLARTDKVTGETAAIADSNDFIGTYVTLSEDNVLVASSNTSGVGPKPGFIVRFPRR
jgi:hypothetical protein